ncbi:Uncharacterised protein [Sebaldella termitidis]|jgi:hypothetical protein|uniref:Uncharacterized protein n=1 Tax=Sebaldella termitidis (strain ATCC 33386 / NCTC 11300) TaxID=526218 RepID=D1APD5_SEBTE|nr:hypothetical protein [Sebaldella termitidis]ACZ09969.1 hypothetical protein Sterm_3127 [Sebaldella termitidis ATCC 33386]SUI25301.1 Uncharacterised protein [Sebaldella termitidis]
MKKVVVTLLAVVMISGGAEYYSHFVVSVKKGANEKEVSKLLAEKKEKEEQFKLTEIKLKRFEDENKDLKELKEGKK